MELLLVICGIFVALFAIHTAQKNKIKAHAEELSSRIIAHMRRKSDHDFSTQMNNRVSWLFVWRPEKTIYFSPMREEFNIDNFFGPNDIVSWSIERTHEQNNNRYWYSYSVNVATRKLSRPLIKIHCGTDESAAYEVGEILRQTYGGEILPA